MGKSRNSQLNICTVTVKLCDGPDKLEGTSSAILIDWRQNLVITHGSILYPLAHKIERSKLRALQSNGVIDGKLFKGKIEVEVVVPNEEITTRDQNHQTSSIPSMLNCNVQEAGLFSRNKGSINMLFECKSLRQTLEKIMPSDSWQFVEDEVSGGNADNIQSGRNNADTAELYNCLLPCFLVIKLANMEQDLHKRELYVHSGAENRQGDPVEICATPFGSLSPEIFLNSRSQGIISNLAGPRGVLIMTDARCVPGSEGGALFYCDQGKRLLTGIMIASLCWKNNEWVGLSMACTMSEVMGSLKGYITLNPDVTLTLHDYNSNYDPSIVRGLISQVGCVSVGHSWGSAVYLEVGTNITCLTCRHVVKGADYHGVTIRDSFSSEVRPCEVQYRTPAGTQFDLAVIRVNTKGGNQLTQPCKPAVFGSVQEGDPVYVVGHGVFKGDLNLSPTVTMGIVSKVIKYNKIPVMLQTTCAVHAGASGGGVFNKFGQLVGVVVCNSKDTVSGSLYPHLNMCVPIATVSSVLQKFLSTKDVSVLQGLHIKNPRISSIWSVGGDTVNSRL